MLLGLALALVVSLALPRGAAAEPAGSGAAQQEQLGHVEKALTSSRQQQKALSQEHAQLEQQAADLKTRLVAAAAAEQKQEALIESLQQRLAALEIEEKREQADLLHRQGELAATLGALARLAREPKGAVLAAPGSAVERLHSSLLLGAIVPELSRRAASLKQKLVALAATRAELGQEQQKLNAAMSALLAQRGTLADLLKEKQVAIGRNQKARRSAAHEEARLAAKAHSLKALIAEIEAAEAERRRQAALAAAQARAEAEARAQAQARAQAAAPAAGGGAEQVTVGQAVLLPAAGHLIARFGQKSRSGATLEGIRIQTLPDGLVVSPVAGRVVFAGPFRDYGQLLIIEYGEGYHVLLSGFAHIAAAVGQRLLAGEPVGRMGGEKGRKPVLYVELRRKGEPVDPLPWLTARERKVSG